MNFMLFLLALTCQMAINAQTLWNQYEDLSPTIKKRVKEQLGGLDSQLNGRLGWELEKVILRQMVLQEAKSLLNEVDLKQSEREDALKLTDDWTVKVLEGYEDLDDDQRTAFKETIINLYPTYKKMTSAQQSTIREDILYVQNLNEFKRDKLLKSIQQTLSDYFRTSNHNTSQKAEDVFEQIHNLIVLDQQPQEVPNQAQITPDEAPVMPQEQKQVEIVDPSSTQKDNSKQESSGFVFGTVLFFMVIGLGFWYYRRHRRLQGMQKGLTSGKHSDDGFSAQNYATHTNDYSISN